MTRANPKPPLQHPAPLRFSVRQLMLAVTAFAVYLGLLRWIGPLAFYFAIGASVALLVTQRTPEVRGIATLAAQIVGMVVLPLSFLALSRFDFVQDHVPRWLIVAFICWAGGVGFWILCQFFHLPWIAALLTGYFTVVGGIFIWIGGILTLAGSEPPAIGDGNAASDLPLILAFAQVAACVLAGWVVGISFFAAAVQAWRRSNRNLLSWFLVFLGILFAIATPVLVVVLLSKALP